MRRRADPVAALLLLGALAALAVAAGCAPRAWHTVEGGRVSVSSSLPDHEVQRLLDEAEATRAETERLLAMPPSGDTIEVRVFRTALARFLHVSDRCPDQRWTAAACWFEAGRAVAAITQGSGARRALRHELAHALLDLGFPETPPWLHEGLAQCVADPPRDDEAGLLEGLLDEDGARLKALVTVRWGDRLSRRQYREARALVRDLLARGPQGLEALRRYLGAVDRASDLWRVYAESFPDDPPAEAPPD